MTAPLPHFRFKQLGIRLRLAGEHAAPRDRITQKKHSGKPRRVGEGDVFAPLVVLVNVYAVGEAGEVLIRLKEIPNLSVSLEKRGRPEPEDHP
jgi:hypothetical protein